MNDTKPDDLTEDRIFQLLSQDCRHQLPILLNRLADGQPYHYNTIAGIQPFYGIIRWINSDFTHKIQALAILKKWFGENQNGQVFYQTLPAIFNPIVIIESGWGASRCYDRKLIKSQEIERLIKEWSNLQELLEDESGNYWHYFRIILENWDDVNDDCDLNPKESQLKQIMEGVGAIVKDIARIYQSTSLPGLQSELDHLAEELDIEIENNEIDPDYNLIFNSDDQDDDQNDWPPSEDDLKKTIKDKDDLGAIKSLAQRYAKQDPEQVIAKLDFFCREAQLRPDSFKDCGVYFQTLADQLAEEVDDPQRWVRAILSKTNVISLSHPFIDRLQTEKPQDSLILKALDHHQHRLSVIKVVLERKFQNDILWKNVYRLLNAADQDEVDGYMNGVILESISRGQLDVETIKQLLLSKNSYLAVSVAGWLINDGYMEEVILASIDRGQLDVETTKQLLLSKNSYLAVSLADRLAIKGRGAIRDKLLPILEKVVVSHDVFRFTYYYAFSLGYIAKGCPEIFIQWLRRQVDKPKVSKNYLKNLNLLFDCVDFATPSSLPKKQRLEIIKELPDTKTAAIIATWLVSFDSDLFRELLKNPNADDYRLKPLGEIILGPRLVDEYDGPEIWAECVEIALENGCSQTEIVNNSLDRGLAYSIESRILKDDYRQVKSKNPAVKAVVKECLDRLSQ